MATDGTLQVGADGLIRGLEPPRERGSWLGRHPNVIRAVTVGSFLLIWEIYGRSLNPIFLSYPTAIAAAFVELLLDGTLIEATLQSLAALSLGFSIALVSGIVTGLLMGRYRTVYIALDPFIIALYNTPSVALIPLIQLWFGLGLEAKVVIVILSAYFPIVLNTYAGVRNTSRGMVDVVRAFGASDRQVMAKVVLPGAVPFIMAGVRLAVGRAVIGVVVAEFFTAVSGLGGLIVVYSNSFATAKLFVPVLTLVALGLVLTSAARAIETRFATWKETERAT
jgi:NitT/TauT family transport system permease protein